ncbi:hypothetical protein NDU88_001781 [Pleurodeles waltl]|uniref:Uncharacterized protein n=1 Tax=Pleurodeles waltl TaxID=8319 RepID=A0AAV7LMK4_PLEWA|nr:hypothetical protein NDU88_001781 [Pleurodeles waltl]
MLGEDNLQPKKGVCRVPQNGNRTAAPPTTRSDRTARRRDKATYRRAEGTRKICDDRWSFANLVLFVSVGAMSEGCSEELVELLVVQEMDDDGQGRDRLSWCIRPWGALAGDPEGDQR